jgi:two-component system cell cycle sensor histidine kinase/response regulator CckA
MKNWLSELCSTAFMPHGSCYLWQPGLVGLHVVADSLIALAYYSIPLTLIYYVRKGRDVAYPAMFLMFAAFIVACGTTHVMEVIAVWTPAYWISGGIKAATALISVVSAVALVRVIPHALELPSRKELRLLNEQLEERVRERTADLTAANEKLTREAATRTQAEADVRRLNAEAQRSVAELQTLFNLMPVGVGIATDAACADIRFNPAYAEMHGLPPNGTVSFTAPPTPLSRTFRLLQDGQELPPGDQPMQRAVTTNTIVRDFEKTILRHDGTTIEVLATAVPIRDQAGQPTGCVATFQDITTHKQAERQRLDFERKLQQSQKLESIGVLAGGIAHDFNNLLTGVLGHANLARAQLARGVTAVDPSLAQVEIAAQRAADLCRQLLAYAGKGRFVIKPLDLNLAVTQALPLVKLSISKKITLDLDLGESLPPFRGDATQINQILMNLAINASEAIGDKVGTMTLRTKRVQLAAMDLFTLVTSAEMEPGNYVCLEVVDNGCGIPPEAINHIFEPFFTTKFVGRGLGLAAVLGIMQGHRGGVRVESTVGAGTTFTLFFPVQGMPSPNTVPGATAPLFAPALPCRGTVLVVDDEDAVRHLAKSALNDAGFTVMLATNGEEALATVRRNPTQFDAVLLDLTMPKLDGEDTLVALRMIAPSLPVILTSGFNEQALARRFVGRGLADFLPKPFGASKLVALLSAVIAEANDRA